MGDGVQQNASDMQIQQHDKNEKDGQQQTSVGRRPTYAQWIAAAIDSTTDRAMTLADINEWMIKNVPGLAEQRYLHSCKGWKNTKIKIEPTVDIGYEVLTCKAPKLEKSVVSATISNRSDDINLLISRENKVEKCCQHHQQKSDIDFDHMSPFSILPIQQLLIVNQKDGSVQKLLLPSPLPLTDPSAQFILGQSLSVSSSGLSFNTTPSPVNFFPEKSTNAVRHTLSVNRARFEKVAREGRPSLWTLAAKEAPMANRRSPLSSIPPSSVSKIIIGSDQQVITGKNDPMALARMEKVSAAAPTPPADGRVIDRPNNDSYLRNGQYDRVVLNGHNPNSGMPHLATTQTIQVVFNDGLVAAVALPRPLPVNGLTNLSKLGDMQQLSQTNASKAPPSQQQQISDAMYVEMARFLLYQQLSTLNRMF